MKKNIPKLAVLLLGLYLPTVVCALDVSLKYERYPDKLRSYRPTGRMSVQLKVKPPSGDWKIPDLKSEHPLYALVRIGDNEQLLILDMQKKDDPYYNRIYFDSDSDHNLKNDPVTDTIVSNRMDSGRNYFIEFPPIDTEIDVDGKKLPYSFRPRAYGQSIRDVKMTFSEQNIRRYINFSLSSNCSYSGEFKIDGRKYRMTFSDYNGNGRFDDRLEIVERRLPPGITQRIPMYPLGDRVIISDGDKIEYYDEMIFGDMLFLKDTLYKVDISTKDGRLTLTEITDGLVSLKLPMTAKRLSFCTENKKQCLIVYQAGEEVLVPKGSYRLLSYQVYSEDDQGDLWRVCASATNKSPVVTVSGDSAVLPFGEPFMPVIDVPNMNQQASRMPRNAYLQFNVVGAGNELVTDVSHISGNKTSIKLSSKQNLKYRPKEPSYKIVKTDGEVVSQGSFEYG